MLLDDAIERPGDRTDEFRVGVERSILRQPIRVEGPEVG
jgi:hypothetical protein